MVNNNIQFPDNNYDFNKVSLANPVVLQQQNYFSKLLYNDNEIYIQMPKCCSKQGFVNSSKRYYCDLMFSNTNNTIIEWFEKLESSVQKLIYEKRKNWFHEDIDQNDIENIFTSPLRTYKSGKFFLLRTMLNSPRMLQTNNLSIFDENENEMTMNDVNENTNFISILHIHGVKFSSRNFQIFIEMKQMMVINNETVFNKCLIKASDNNEENNEVINEENSNMNKEDKTIVKKITTEKEDVKEEVKGEKEEKKEEQNVIENDQIEKHLDETETIEKEEIIDSNNETNEIAAIEDLTDKISSEKVEIQNENKDNNLSEVNLAVLNLENNKKDLEEIELDINDPTKLETITLNKSTEKYLIEYREAKEKARKARIVALKSLLKAKNIKDKYLLDNMEISDDEDDNTTIHTSDLESNIDSLESLSDDEEIEES